MVKLCVLPLRLPSGALTLAWVMALRTSSSVRPRLASAAGLTWMRTAGLMLPSTLTRPTPDICASFCARMLSA